MHRFKLKQPGTPEAVFNIDGMLKYPLCNHLNYCFNKTKCVAKVCCTARYIRGTTIPDSAICISCRAKYGVFYVFYRNISQLIVI